MFWKKKQQNTDESYEEKIRAAKYGRILQSLKDILKLEVKSTAKNGQDEIDYMATCSAIKTKARLAIDFVADLEKNGDD